MLPNSESAVLGWKGKENAVKHYKRVSKAKFRSTDTLGEKNGKIKHQAYFGDNLEVCKHLLSKKTEKFDLIFCDPPYNSNRDFCVNDDAYYDHNKKPYSVQKVHRSRWLSMLYSRLLLARELLEEPSGLLVMCLDEKEYPSGRLLLDEIFGSHNFIGTFIWKSMEGTKNTALFTNNHTYIIFHAVDRKYWEASDRKIRFRLDSGELHSVWTDLPTSLVSRDNLAEVLTGKVHPDVIRVLNPKPQDLLTRILKLSQVPPGGKILDLFAGSGSLLEAVLKYNKNYGTTHEIVSIQYPVKLAEIIRTKDYRDENPNFTNISDIFQFRYKQILKKFPHNALQLYHAALRTQ